MVRIMGHGANIVGISSQIHNDLQNNLRLPLVAHNRYWSVNTTYAKVNGGDFDFIIGPNVSLPLNKTFWDFLFARARNNWGLIVYEQDWLNVQLLSTPNLTNSLTNGRDWLLNMGAAAAANGLKLQYCMSLPRHALQSIEIPVVTQVTYNTQYISMNSSPVALILSL
ncbi:hypothetical protein Btru_035382 [Bulinus truncatus]|nr:hypothetical protein Btru_035382 [Bulinus truncatus]